MCKNERRSKGYELVPQGSDRAAIFPSSDSLARIHTLQMTDRKQKDRTLCLMYDR